MKKEIIADNWEIVFILPVFILRSNKLWAAPGLFAYKTPSLVSILRANDSITSKLCLHLRIYGDIPLIRCQYSNRGWTA